MFPVEIWKEILKYVEASDLTRLRTVCSTWNDVIEEILKRRNIWYGRCVKDIPENQWYSILHHRKDVVINRRKLHETETKPQVWYEMYRSWRKWHTITKKIPQLKTIKLSPLRRRLQHFFSITCFSVLGDVIAIGSAEGYVAFYLMDRDEIVYAVDHGYYVQSILLRRGGTLLAVTTSTDIINFWDLTHMFEERSRLAKISITDIFPNETILKDAFVSDAILAALPRWSREHLQTEGFYQQENNVEILVELEQPEIEIRYCRIFHDSIVACIGVHGELGLSVNGGSWRIYDLVSKLGAPVTAVIFHVAMLALGLESGRVHLFPISGVENLVNLDFDEMESQEILVDTKAIISLNTTEYDSVQYLVAVSNTDAHIINFF